MTTEERKEQFAAAYKTVITSDKFKCLLKLRTSATLRRFSLGNLVNLMFQSEIEERPMPTLLKTYKGWLKLERQVQQCEKCWYVLAPNKYTKEEEDGTKSTYLTGWHFIAEFDVSQTEGEPLPEDPPDLTTADHLEQHLWLTEWAYFEHGTPIRWSDTTGGAKGWYDPEKNEITLREDLSVDESLTVLVHELIHSMGVDYKEYSREDAECITETACAIVCMGLGLDETDQAVNYVSHWAGQDPERGLKLLGTAEKFARQLENALAKNPIQREEAA